MNTKLCNVSFDELIYDYNQSKFDERIKIREREVYEDIRIDEDYIKKACLNVIENNTLELIDSISNIYYMNSANDLKFIIEDELKEIAIEIVGVEI